MWLLTIVFQLSKPWPWVFNATGSFIIVLFYLSLSYMMPTAMLYENIHIVWHSVSFLQILTMCGDWYITVFHWMVHATCGIKNDVISTINQIVIFVYYLKKSPIFSSIFLLRCVCLLSVSLFVCRPPYLPQFSSDLYQNWYTYSTK